MSRGTYASALDKTLRPLGFERRGDYWIRVRGDIQDRVNRQSSWLGGVTVNLFLKDLETEKLFLEIFAPEGAIQMPSPRETRLGHLMGPRDRWWTKDEPDGPREMAAAVVEYGLPWFDQQGCPVEVQAEQWYRASAMLASTSTGFERWSTIGLALTLYRLGRLDDACRVVSRPPRKNTHPTTVAMVARVREWLGCPTPTVA